MRKLFEQDLQEVQVRLVELAKGAKVIMKKGSSAFLESDVALADEALALATVTNERLSISMSS